ncbi:protein of unknown function [Burkholderia multivorans]
MAGSVVCLYGKGSGGERLEKFPNGK